MTDKLQELLFEPASYVKVGAHVHMSVPKDVGSRPLTGKGLVVCVFGGVAGTWSRKEARTKLAALLGMVDPALLSEEGRRLANAVELESD